MIQNNNAISESSEKSEVPVPIKKQYSSVELCIDNLGFVYQFKIWETDTPEINILVNQDSDVLKHLHVGNTFDIKYYPSDYSGYPVTMRTKIKHIKKNCERRIKGHCLVGLSVNEMGKKN